ncbi:class I SAM-dependent methyltransferase [Chitinivorax sp. B]|uniref:O-methyltransferase n=1 Tax=Chitinivorax sp. B TaxID=2502235 RepID=UPI0010F7A19C|nr:class I SAM-dependent methyltransferase [Chitinivorax sp. B]
MNRTLAMTDTLYAYLLQVGTRESDVLRRLREETAQHRLAKMQIAPEQGQIMSLLARLIGAKRTIEIGVFTGYSTLVTAQALPAGGEIIACDVSDTFTDIAKRYWAEAGVADRIHLHLQPAQVTLDALLANGELGQFDMAFIDADKPGYARYYESCLQLVRPGGVVLLDNMFLGGRVTQDPTLDETPSIGEIRKLNAFLQRDERIDYTLLPIGDGLTICHKR